MARSVEDRMSFMEHLGELRVRIVRALYALLVGSVPGLYFSQQIVDWLARPVTKLNYSLVFTSPAEALWVQMKVGLIVGLFIAAPGILWQVWAFIAPGLHAHEKKYALPFVLIGSLLFIGGGAFSLFVVTPYALQFLLSYARPGLQPMITLQNLTDFLLKFTLAFGAVFELPLALTLLARLGVVNANMLAKNRKYAILGAFIAGAVLTPTPDAFNQTLMAGPLVLLYEVGIVCARVFGRKPAPASAPPAGVGAPRMLVIAPTRELVVQIESDARLLGRFTPFRTLAVYGGIDYAKQREALAAGCDILVGTPGRLIDYLKQRVWSPRHVEVLVIDEADRMFDMGFIADLRFILRRLPPHDKRQSFLFSATLSFRVLELTWEFMNNPSQITIMPQQKTAERVEQMLYHVGRDEKFPLLLGLLKREGGDRILIFTNTREEARRLEDRLTRNRYDTRALTGDVDQKRRLKILNDFKEGRLPVLVATDVASRGLHIEAVSHVVNWDLPQDAEDYVHRIGRTARAGAGGKALSLVDEASALYLEPIEKFIGQKIPVEWADDDLFVAEIKPTAEERRRFAEERRARLEARGGRFGDRGRRDHPRGGPDRRRHEPPHRADRPPAPPPPPGGAAGQGRRRRRRGGRGGGGARPGGPSP